MTSYQGPKVIVRVADDGLLEADLADEAEAQWWGYSALESLLRDGPAASRRDLAERTSRFGEAAIRFARRIPQGRVNNRLIDQWVGAATSIGANYCEADEGVSRKDFMNRIGTCKKEAREAQFFLRMIVTSEPWMKDEARILWLEAKELTLISAAIFHQR